MKNRDLLQTAEKPAPGDLAYVQGFINLRNVELGRDEMESVRSLKAWLVRHGLLSPAAKVGKADLKTALAFREALRSLLLANNGRDLDEGAVRYLNLLSRRLKFRSVFLPDGTAGLRSASRGFDGALGKLLLTVLDAMCEGTWLRLKACDEDNCLWAFYDSSKNRSGRWCAMEVCGCRVKAREYRKRKAREN